MSQVPEGRPISLTVSGRAEAKSQTEVSMNVERVTTLAATDGHNIPAYLLAPYTAQGGAVLIPPYGGTKEHMLGIAVTLGEAGIATLAIDLCGHLSLIHISEPTRLGMI